MFESFKCYTRPGSCPIAYDNLIFNLVGGKSLRVVLQLLGGMVVYSYHKLLLMNSLRNPFISMNHLLNDFFRRRVSSTTSGPRSDIDLASSCDESTIPVVPATPTGATTTTPYHKDSVSTPVTPSIGMGPGSGAFRFHKTKKVGNPVGWISRSSIRTISWN